MISRLWVHVVPTNTPTHTHTQDEYATKYILLIILLFLRNEVIWFNVASRYRGLSQHLLADKLALRRRAHAQTKTVSSAEFEKKEVLLVSW